MITNAADMSSRGNGCCVPSHKLLHNCDILEYRNVIVMLIA